MAVSELWAGLGSVLAVLVTIVTVAINHVKIKLLINKIATYIDPYIKITIPEYSPECFQRSDFFVTIEAYLSETCAHGARKLRAELDGDKKKPQMSVDDEQEIIDTYGGATLWWYAVTELPRSNVFSFRAGDEKRRFYRVSFHKKFHKSIVESYLPHVIEKGRAIMAENRQRRLFTNNPSSRWSSYEERKTYWTHVEFQHPATFDTLAMDPTEKASIVDDLRAFIEGKDYYTRIGKAWKRGYLLFGPPGTGKSTMIAAMANFLDYDVYDLELTAVKNNTELRKLFIETKGKSIIVIEDIDCSVDLTGKRQKKKAHKKSGDDVLTKTKKNEDEDDTKLTLSGVLNFIDGLWSACGGERIIIFTTNNKDKLDPALIRPGRMDKHIEMSYCRYEAFRVLASNYLYITEHQRSEMFGEIQQLLKQVNMSPAEVAGYLMLTEKKDATVCLEGLLVALKNLKKAKEDAAIPSPSQIKGHMEV